MNIRMKRGMALALTASLLLAGSAQALFGLGKSKPETVSPENGPTARDLEIRTYRGIPYLGQLEAADPDGGELTFAIVTQPKKGTVTVEGANFTYTPKETPPEGTLHLFRRQQRRGRVPARHRDRDHRKDPLRRYLRGHRRGHCHCRAGFSGAGRVHRGEDRR